MSQPSLVVPLADLEREPRDVEWELSAAWLGRALEGTDATPVGPGRLEARLTKNGKEVLVQGRATAKVSVPDARTLEPVEVKLESTVLLMLVPAAGASRPKRGRSRARTAGAAQEKKRRGWRDDPELSDAAAGQDCYSGEEIVLDGFVRELLLLELPMVVHKDLPTGHAPAIAPPPAPESEAEGRVDPRLAPLAAIAARLRERKN